MQTFLVFWCYHSTQKNPLNPNWLGTHTQTKKKQTTSPPCIQPFFVSTSSRGGRTHFNFKYIHEHIGTSRRKPVRPFCHKSEEKIRKKERSPLRYLNTSQQVSAFEITAINLVLMLENMDPFPRHKRCLQSGWMFLDEPADLLWLGVTWCFFVGLLSSGYDGPFGYLSRSGKRSFWFYLCSRQVWSGK